MDNQSGSLVPSVTSHKVAVIGTGYWGKNLVRNFHSLGVLHTIFDLDHNAAEYLCKRYPGTNKASSLTDIIENHEITGIVIATPAVTHYALAKKFLTARKDVLVEKPLCLSENEGAELIRLAEENGRILMVGHLLWYHPCVLKLQELILAGELGRIQYIYSNRLNLGKLRREENVLWSFAPHDISVILGLIEEEPEYLQAHGGNFLHDKIADTTITMLNFPSGIKAHIFVSWLHPFKEQKLVVVGDRKMAVFDDGLDWAEKLSLYPHSISWTGNVPVANKAEVEFVATDTIEPLREECKHFLDCIQSRSMPKTDGREGLRVLKVLNSCQRSLEDTLVPSPTVAREKYWKHDTVILDDDVKIGRGTKIWHFSHVMSGALIGHQCNIGQNVVIGNNVIVGNKCKIQNNVSVYEGVTIEDEVFCGPSMVFTNVFNPRAGISRKNEYRKTLVCRGATLGANCTIVCGVTLGQYCFIGAGAVVNTDVPDYALMVGVPAKQIGWMSRFGERLDLPVKGMSEAICPHTGEIYRLDGGLVTLVQ